MAQCPSMLGPLLTCRKRRSLSNSAHCSMPTSENWLQSVKSDSLRRNGQAGNTSNVCNKILQQGQRQQGYAVSAVYLVFSRPTPATWRTHFLRAFRGDAELTAGVEKLGDFLAQRPGFWEGCRIEPMLPRFITAHKPVYEIEWFFRTLIGQNAGIRGVTKEDGRFIAP
jgi:hypothetical protein